MIHQGKQRIGQLHYPGDRGKQAEAHKHRAHQADTTRAVLLIFREFGDNQRKKNNIVDAQHDFQNGERAESQPCIGICNPVEHCNIAS